MQHLKLPFYILLLLFSFTYASLLISLNETVPVYGVFVIDDDEKEDSSKAKIVLIEQKYKSDRFNDNIIGQVLNIGNGSAEFVQISFNLFSKKGDLIGTDVTYPEQDILNPGQKSSFNLCS